MSARQYSFLPPLAAIAALAIILPSLDHAQAPPGPIVPPSSATAPPAAQSAPPQARPLAPPQPRTSILGEWRFNRDQSTLPRSRDDDASSGDNPSNNGGNGPHGDEPRDQGQEPRPSTTLTVEQKDHEFDITDDRNIRTALFTDGRKLQKSKEGDSYREVAAKGDEMYLVADEKSSRGDKFTRTFELSPDGLQLIETVRLDRRSDIPQTTRYVYDIYR